MAQIKLNATYGMTGTLPAVSGANLTTLNGTQVTSGTLPMARLSGTLPALNGSALTTLNASNVSSGTLATARYADATGFAEVDMWRLIADFTQGADPVTTNFERCDTDGFEKIGTGMSHSAGVFTFGATGLFKVTWQSQHRRNGENPALETGFEYSSNSGVSWSEVATCKPSLQEYTSTVYSSASCHGIINVTNASTYRIRAVVRNATDVYTNGATASNATYFIFERLGDSQ